MSSWMSELFVLGDDEEERMQRQQHMEEENRKEKSQKNQLPQDAGPSESSATQNTNLSSHEHRSLADDIEHEVSKNISVSAQLSKLCMKYSEFYYRT